MKARFLPLGDQALTVELGSEISVEINQRVHALCTALRAQHIEGVTELVPTYCSLTVHYRPEIIRYHALIEICRRHVDTIGPLTELKRSRILEIPVLYGGTVGVDLASVAEYHGMMPEEVVKAHSRQLHKVYMIGFWPGMPYMEAPDGLTIPRRASPRLNVCRGAVIVQTTQTNILPNDTPTGWHILGHTPVRPFDLRRPEPALFRPGDWIRFLPVDKSAYEEIRKQADVGTYQVRITEEA